MTTSSGSAPAGRPARRSIWDFQRVRRVVARLLRNRGFQARSKRLAELHYLNVGCGGNPLPGFINLDYGWSRKVDLCWDLTRGIPLSDDSLQGIYSEHCLEHVELHEAYEAMLDFRRMLRPGGTVRIAVPDGERYLDLYEKSRTDPAVSFPGGPPAESEPEHGITPMVIVNRAFRAFGHRFVYDFKTMSLLLRGAGFVDVRQETFRQGRDEALLVDYAKRASNSLYVEASAPASDAEGVTSGAPFSVATLTRYLAGGPPPGSGSGSAEIGAEID